MSAREFQPGELVDITIRGARVFQVDGNELTVQYQSDGIGAADVEIALDGYGVTVERVAPAEWPPRPGDLWRDRLGSLWFAFLHLLGNDSRVLMHPHDPSKGFVPIRPDQVMPDHGPLELVHREPEESDR